MKRAWAVLIVAGMILAGAGCRSFDDSQEQSEYERLRTSPHAPQPDRILPAFDPDSTSDEGAPFAVVASRNG